MCPPFDAVVLAGGAGRRLGRDKPAVEVGGVALVDRVLGAAASAGASRLIVVGPRRVTRYPHIAVREHPAGGGPVAALAAALPAVHEPVTALLAADLAFLDAAALHQLRQALEAAVDVAGAVAVDGDGRAQWLLGAWRTTPLRVAVTAVARPAGAALGAVLRTLATAEVPLVGKPERPPPWFDCDTPADLATAQEAAGTIGTPPASRPEPRSPRGESNS